MRIILCRRLILDLRGYSTRGHCIRSERGPVAITKGGVILKMINWLHGRASR